MLDDSSSMKREIPILDVGRRGAVGLYEAAAADAAALIASAMGGHVALEIGGRLGDRLSRLWLKRRSNPFYGEIATVARAIGRPGVYLLNIIYEWACSTSAGPDPTAEGNRMIRVLDWGLRGIGRYVVIGQHDTDHGVYFNVTWPGYAGVLTAMAPGRFSAAINQAPRLRPSGMRWLDEVIVHLGMFRTMGTIPVSHLLRRVFEEAADYASAQGILMDESIDLAMPALFTLSGIEAAESCVIEAIGCKRVLHASMPASDGIVGVANNWLSPDLPGEARDSALARTKHKTTAAANTARRNSVCQLQRGAFAGVIDLTPPVLNGLTVLVAIANARQGTLVVEALDHGADRNALPHVVSRVSIGGPALPAIMVAGAA
jgi:hypothetical protein